MKYFKRGIITEEDVYFLGPIVDKDCNVTIDWSSLDLDTHMKIQELRSYISEAREAEYKKLQAQQGR